MLNKQLLIKVLFSIFIGLALSVVLYATYIPVLFLAGIIISSMIFIIGYGKFKYIISISVICMVSFYILIINTGLGNAVNSLLLK